MSRAEYEYNDSIRSTYSRLSETWCGKGNPPIPRVPFDTFNPPFHHAKNCPGEWGDNACHIGIGGSPSMETQVVLDYAPLGYNSLMHNTAPTSSGYLSYLPAYYNDKSGYRSLFRKCDGSFVPAPPSPSPVPSPPHPSPSTSSSV